MHIIGKFGPFEPGQVDCDVKGTVVHFGEQFGKLFVWATFSDMSAPRYYAIIPTGEELMGREHVKTHVQDSGLVWHLVR